MQADADRLFDSGNSSDLTVVCKEAEFKVHKAVLCPRSTFFSNACNSAFLVSWLKAMCSCPILIMSQEAKTNRVVLNDEDPDKIRAFLLFCYVQAYITPNSEPLEEQFIKHITLYAMGEKYGVPALKVYAAKAFKKLLPINGYEAKIVTPRIIENVYTCTVKTDRPLRNVLVSYLKRVVFNSEGFTELESLLETVDGLAYDLLDAQVGLYMDHTMLSCRNPSCKDYVLGPFHVDVGSRTDKVRRKCRNCDWMDYVLVFPYEDDDDEDED